MEDFYHEVGRRDGAVWILRFADGVFWELRGVSKGTLLANYVCAHPVICPLIHLRISIDLLKHELNIFVKIDMNNTPLIQSVLILTPCHQKHQHRRCANL
jgi:hypothetical protein